MALRLPGLDHVGKQQVVRALALAKQQPVPVLACMRGLAQQAAQAGAGHFGQRVSCAREVVAVPADARRPGRVAVPAHAARSLPATALRARPAKPGGCSARRRRGRPDGPGCRHPT
ncbi:hypothetical protein G6F40_015895 [Rhizopus arrhizus]|nr:hypothetical protein G6F40_015895 [Rhizopus arrhizus]